MLGYTVKRLGLSLLTMLVVTGIVYILFAVVPGSYVDGLLSQSNLTAEARQHLIAEYGYDKPPVVRYLVWLSHLVVGDPDTGRLGYSGFFHAGVGDVITQRLLPTVILIGCACVVQLAIAIPLGTLGAVRRNAVLDHAITGFSCIGLSMPSYWLGALLIFAFALPHGSGPGLLPGGGMGSGGPADPFADPLDLLRHLILPTIVLAVPGTATETRYIRSTMAHALSQSHVRTARSQGPPARPAVIRSAFRTLRVPLITLMALDLPTLFVGAVITEFVFSWPGMGQLFIFAAHAHDTPTLVGIVLILSILAAGFSFLADLLGGWAGPRIRLAEAR